MIGKEDEVCPGLLTNGHEKRTRVVPEHGGLERKRAMLRFRRMWGFLLVFSALAAGSALGKELKVEGRVLQFETPPFRLMLPVECQLIHTSSVENKEENSRTRSYLLAHWKKNQAEEIVIIQIADKTDPRAGPMVVPPLKPLSEKRLFSKGKRKRTGLEIDYLIQAMAWNPASSSLRPLKEKGVIVPSSWVLQGQFLFPYYGDHAVLVRYSKDVNSFGWKVSQEGKNWERESISGNERKTLEVFEKMFLEVIDSLRID
jgi:hypothetical protein